MTLCLGSFNQRINVLARNTAFDKDRFDVFFHEHINQLIDALQARLRFRGNPLHALYIKAVSPLLADVLAEQEVALA